jgi:glycosyltransferase involved in cell wall biosynthesis
MRDRETKPIKIFLLVESGESSRFWQGSIPLLLSADFKIVLLTVRERGPLLNWADGLAIPTIALNCQTSFDYPMATLRLASLIRKLKPDIIHATESIPASIGASASRIAGHCKCIFHRQHNFLGGPQRILSRVGSLFAHRVMACSATTASYANRIDKVPPSRIQVGYNGVPKPRPVSSREVTALRTKLKIPTGAAVVAIVARLRPEKGHVTLMEAMTLLRKRMNRDLRLVVVGSGPYEEVLKSKIGIYDPKTLFVGHQTDIALWFSLADVVAMPSYTEPFGLSAVEAMAARRPLVASDVDGLSEIIENKISGLLVPPQNPVALANALQKVLQSPTLSEKLASGALARAQQFTTQKMVEGWRSCYAAVLEKSNDSAFHPAGNHQ